MRDVRLVLSAYQEPERDQASKHKSSLSTIDIGESREGSKCFRTTVNSTKHVPGQLSVEQPLGWQ
jgi:hypothetical protein